MNPIVVLLANGDAFFLGIGMVLASLLPKVWVRSSVALMILRIIGILGVALIFASSTPFPIWVYGLWLILWLMAFLLPFARTKRVIIPVFTVISMLLCLIEFPHHLNPQIAISGNPHVYVLGDSLSAGMGTSETNWPVVLGDISLLNVTNLAQPGATTSSALAQVKGILIPGSLVIIEIGGNDLLGGTSSGQFYKDLDVLLQQVSTHNHCVMFELPLLPFHNGYGEAQRNLARKYKITLIPKSCLAGVIAKSDNTIDGLHLSQKGHNVLAAAVFGMFEMHVRL